MKDSGDTSLMPMISVIICTCNRADDLRQTLAAVARVCVPEQMPTELLVVDNASTDATAEVIASCNLPHMPVRYIHEPRRGKGYAYNAGMAAARGDIFLFTDDDVRPPKNWIEGMCGPILSGGADAVAGGVTIAPHLERKGSVAGDRTKLASTDYLDQANPSEMVGANMAFSRTVLEKVPAFDTELGPGALGFGDETLFSWQLRAAGYRMVPRFEIAVEHHFDPARLTRKGMVAIAEGLGRSHAYLAYHWRHREERHARLFLVKRTLRLAYTRVVRRKEIQQCQEAPEWEFDIISNISFYKQYLKDGNRPKNYDKFGLTKKPHRSE